MSIFANIFLSNVRKYICDNFRFSDRYRYKKLWELKIRYFTDSIDTNCFHLLVLQKELSELNQLLITNID